MRPFAALALAALAVPAAAAEPVVFANGTAVYALSAGPAGAAAGVDLSGSMTSSLIQTDCATYRTSAEMDIEISGPGGLSITQAMAVSYVEAADSLQFESTQTMMGATLEETAGTAVLDGDGITVTHADPEAEPDRYEGPVLFPVELTRQLIEAARSGDAFSTYLLYDGATAGGALLTVSAVFGPQQTGPIEGIEGAIVSAAGWDELRRWPVTLTYFEEAGDGERQPAMSVSMTLIENGFGIDTVYEMGPIEMRLEMISLQPVDPPVCL